MWCVALFVCGSLIGASHKAWAGGFEGTILLKDVSGGEVSTQRLSFKGERLRLEETGPRADGSALILDGRTRESLMIDPDEQAYFPFPWPSSSTEDAAREADAVVVTNTGKRAHVAGHACDLYLERDKAGGGMTEFCLAKELGGPVLFGLTGSDSAIASFLPTWMAPMIKDGAFPIRAIERDKAGKEISRFEATKIESKRLADSLFAPPAGYRRMNMEEMGRGGAAR